MKEFQAKIEKEISLFAQNHPFDYKHIIDKITSYQYQDYTDDYYVFNNFKKQLKRHYLNQAADQFKISRDEKLKQEIIALTDVSYERYYEIMINLDDEEAFLKVLNYAKDFLKGEDFLFFQNLFVNSNSLFALVMAYENPDFKDDVLLFFKTAFDYVKKYAKENNKKNLSTDGDPDGSTLLELAKAFSSFDEEVREQFAGIVYEIYIFSCHDKRSYAMKQASGFIAVLLTLYKTPFDLTPLKKITKREEKHSPNAVYLQQTFYALWTLENNSKDPLLYLQKAENQNVIFAVFTLTDLNCKEALPLCIEKQKTEKNPVIWEIYEEAISRLQSDFASIKDHDKMISMYDSLTPSQRALGALSDNVFVERAKRKYKIDNTIYETDQD